MSDADRLLEQLNPPQREAVTCGEGPLLILAGAGTGKTRVITHRIAWLVASRLARPAEIVAVTFTNKAAAEMKGRAEQLLGGDLAGAFLGTFHAFCLKLLRTHAAAAGLPQDFVIYDSADQLAVVRQTLKDMGIDERLTPPRQILAVISRRKNALLAAGAAEAGAAGPRAELFAHCHERYDDALRRAGALDFDDLLVRAVRLLEHSADLRERWGRRARWLLVDEYQDTNPPQYALIRLLAAGGRNVCCVGDEDQSIYAFRGADIRNILNFGRDFPDARIIKLEQNYRSTGAILAAASALIRHNRRRHDKTLWTLAAAGAPLLLHIAADDRDEADFIVGELLRRSRSGEAALDEMAVLYRTNATSRLIEDRLVAAGVPYRVVGSLRFYERKEIKDLLAWLRLLVHPDSDQDLLRAAAFPPRGLGEKTLALLAGRAAEGRTSLHQAARSAAREPASLGQRGARALAAFLQVIDDLTRLSREASTVAAVQAVIDAVDFLEHLEQAHPIDHTSRAENVGALLAAAREHDEAEAPEGLAGFLDRVSLRSDTDDVKGQNGPALMTVHSAKGLEFDGVIVAGLNEGLFPHVLSAADPEEIEEERRLLYVALTRARRALVLTCAEARRPFGALVGARPSRFLDELPRDQVQATAPAAIGGAAAMKSARRAPRRLEPTRPAGLVDRSGPRRVERDADAEFDEDQFFRPGMRVVHPMFGRGRIVAVEGEGVQLRLRIQFERGGLKKIMARATTLRPG